MFALNRVSCGRLVALAVLVCVNRAAVVHAIAVTVLNPSFENTTLGDGGLSGLNPPVDDWHPGLNPGGGAFIYNPQDAQWLGATDTDATSGQLQINTPPGSGRNVLDIPGIYVTTSVYQDVGPIVPNAVYTLSVAVGNRLDEGAAGIFQTSLVNGTDYTGTVLGTSATDQPAAGTFDNLTMSITTLPSASGHLTIVLTQLLYDGAVDNVRLSYTIVTPEPGSLVLLGLGGIGLAACARRRGRSL